MNFETTIDLEINIEMQTNSKAYSPSPVQYGAEQKTNIPMPLIGVIQVSYLK